MGDHNRSSGLRLALSWLTSNGGGLFFCSLTLVNFGNFVFHAVVSRMLGPAGYGALSALLGLMLTLSVPVGAMQAAITKRIAERSQPVGAGLDLRRLTVHLGTAAVGAGLAIVVAMPLLQRFLHFSSRWAVILLAAFVALVIIGLVPRAVLIGQLRFGVVASALLAGTVVRLVVAVVLVDRGFGLAGAMAASVVAEIMATGALLIPLRHSLSRRKDSVPIVVEWSEAATAVAAFGGYWLLISVDTFLARHYLGSGDSGIYAAAATAGRATLFVSGAVATIAFPYFALADTTEVARRKLRQAVAVAGGLSLAAALLIMAAPSLVVDVVFGKHYESSVGALRLLALASAIFGITNVYVHYHLAMRSRATRIPWIAAGVLTATLAISHGSVTAIAAAVLTISAASLAALTVAAFFQPLEPESDALHRTNPDHHLLHTASSELDLTIVVPHFNAGPRLIRNIERIVAVLERSGTSFEIIAVSDGTTDGSEIAVAELDPQLVKCVNLGRNYGKGQALRVGLSMGRGEYLGFIDADGDLDPTLLEPFIALMRLYEPDIILGSKRHPLSEVEYPPIRRVYSWGYQQLIRVLFRLNIRDTQTGLKLARREVLANALPRMLEKRFAFDLELFVVARRLGYGRFFEAPVRIEHQFSSTINLGAVRGMVLDTLAIFYRLRLLHFYDRPVPPLTEQSALDDLSIGDT